MRSMCALARVVMARRDCKWKARMSQENVELEDNGRFMDNARVFMYPVRPGWRWEEGGLWYSQAWEEKDSLISPTERTKRVVFWRMQGLTSCLSFTVETAEEFVDNWLPTLGFKLRVNSNNIIEY